jgi:hypothetical protein
LVERKPSGEIELKGKEAKPENYDEKLKMTAE